MFRFTLLPWTAAARNPPTPLSDGLSALSLPSPALSVGRRTITDLENVPHTCHSSLAQLARSFSKPSWLNFISVVLESIRLLVRSLILPPPPLFLHAPPQHHCPSRSASPSGPHWQFSVDTRWKLQLASWGSYVRATLHKNYREKPTRQKQKENKLEQAPWIPPYPLPPATLSPSRSWPVTRIFLPFSPRPSLCQPFSFNRMTNDGRKERVAICFQAYDSTEEQNGNGWYRHKQWGARRWKASASLPRWSPTNGDKTTC